MTVDEVFDSNRICSFHRHLILEFHKQWTDDAMFDRYQENEHKYHLDLHLKMRAMFTDKKNIQLTSRTKECPVMH